SIMDWVLNGRIQGTTGNRGVHGEAPSGVYRCQDSPLPPNPYGEPEGTTEDRWIAIDVCEDGEWQALAVAMGQPELADDPRFARAETRRANMDELDGIIGVWTRDKDARDLMRGLQAMGVPAGEVQD